MNLKSVKAVFAEGVAGAKSGVRAGSVAGKGVDSGVGIGEQVGTVRLGAVTGAEAKEKERAGEGA